MSKLTYTSLDEVDQVSAAFYSTESINIVTSRNLQTHAALRAGYKSGKAKSIKYRKHQLLQLAYLLQDNRERFNESIKNDLGRSPMENEMYVNPPSIRQATHPHQTRDLCVARGDQTELR